MCWCVFDFFCVDFFVFFDMSNFIVLGKYYMLIDMVDLWSFVYDGIYCFLCWEVVLVFGRGYY